jgi:predicted RNA-binding protein YlxR (DUF448 family)
VKDAPEVDSEGEDDDTPAGRRNPLRRCIVTGTVRPRQELVRFVISPEGQVVPDLAADLPGRGLWVTAKRAVLAQAVAKQVFAKAARRAVKADAGLVDQVTDLARRRCLDLIGLAKRAGQAVAGFDKVDGALRQGKVAILLAAADGAADGRKKLAALAGSLPLAALFDSAELAAALGREHCVHAAIMPGGLATRFALEMRRYEGLRCVV